MFRDWLKSPRATWKTRRATRRRNYEFLQRVADAVLDEYKSLPYARLVDPRELITGSEAIVNGVWINWSSEFKNSPKGNITITVKLCSKLPTPWGAKPVRSIVMRPVDGGARRETWHWVRSIPIVHIDSVRPTLELPADAGKEEIRAAFEQNSQFLSRIADSIAAEYESLPYALLGDAEKLPLMPEVIVNGVWISWSFVVQKSCNGAIRVDLEFNSNLPAGMPAKSFLKRPDDVGLLREDMQWVRTNPTVYIDGAEPTPPC